ncbi:MAG: hypothetical protein [Bacteriophage sp.]|nr:MAG: hypothetical protein [Bacteriophage sp.]
MAKTLKCQVTFPLTLIVNSESEKDLEGARAEAREIVASGKELRGEQKAMITAFASERTTEQLMELILRKGIRELVRAELKSEMNNSGTKCRIGDIKVDFTPHKTPAPSPEFDSDPSVVGE